MRFASLLLLLLTACASNHFEMVSPATENPQISTDAETQVDMDPLDYRLIVQDGHLIISIDNPSDVPITLLPKSVALDSQGTPHGIDTAIIPPHSSVREIFPPVQSSGQQPLSDSAGPEVSPYDRPGYIPPPGYNPQMQSESTDWDWPASTDVRFHFLYQQGNAHFEHVIIVRHLPS